MYFHILQNISCIRKPRSSWGGGGCTLPLDPSLHILYFVKDIPRTNIVMISATIPHSRSVSQKTYVFIYAILFVITLVISHFSTFDVHPKYCQ